MKKIYLLLPSFFLGVTTMNAQNFTKFDAVDDQGVKALTGLSHRTGKARITLLVPENFNVGNVTVAAEVDSDASFTTIPTDFTTPQTVTITKESALQPKTWTITFKKIKPATLPFTLNFNEGFTTDQWNAETSVGWGGAEIDDSAVNAKQIRFGTAPTAFAIAFNETPHELIYDLNVVGQNPFNGVLRVSAKSATGEWGILTEYTSANPMASSVAESYAHPLASDIRFVKWEYITRDASQNVHLNNIEVMRNDGTAITGIQTPGPVFSVNGNQLLISDPEEVLSVSLFNLQGQKIYQKQAPLATEILTGCNNGICVLSAILKNGQSLKQQLIIN
ncbi:MAG: hypothetical protein RR346_07050 [Bacteroidales bacterium]